MKTVISEALKEVWEWKEKCYEESKGMTVLSYLKKVHSNANDTLEERVSLEIKEEKAAQKAA